MNEEADFVFENEKRRRKDFKTFCAHDFMTEKSVSGCNAIDTFVSTVEVS